MTPTNTQWKTFVSTSSPYSSDIIGYALVRAIRSKSNNKLEVAKGLLYKSFSPITNPNKLANGGTPFQALHEALDRFIWRGVESLSHFNLSDQEKIELKELYSRVAKEDFQDTTYAYIFVRQDLPPAQQVVQTAHCTMVLGQTVSKKSHDAERLHFVVFGCANHIELTEKATFLKSKGIELVNYFESDLIGNQFTSFACLPMRKSFASRKKLFTNDKLLTI